jgi:hypothetical protein
MIVSAFARVPGGQQLRLCYSHNTEEWLILWPCDRCGGVEAPLIARFGAWEMADSLRAVADAIRRYGGCPGCQSREKRRQREREDPEVWWDPSAEGWVVRIRCGALGSAILPLEIRWFDAPAALVHCAAADLAYIGDEFCDPQR